MYITTNKWMTNTKEKQIGNIIKLHDEHINPYKVVKAYDDHV